MEKVDDVEDLDIVMSMYNYLEYSFNYSDTTGSLWFYSNAEVSNFESNDNSKYFKYKNELIGSIAEIWLLWNVIICVPLKYLKSFKRLLKIP